MPPSPPQYPKDAITGVILAGGRGRRMGGKDKGLQPFADRPLIAQVIERIRPQVGGLLISANRNLDAYAAFGLPVLPDAMQGFCGPLAGIATALEASRTDLLLSAPCDSPNPPENLAARLFQALNRDHAEVAVAHDGRRTHQAFALLRRELLPELLAWLERGERGLGAWYRQRRLALADFSDRPQAFVNLNAPDDWQRLAGGPPE